MATSKDDTSAYRTTGVEGVNFLVVSQNFQNFRFEFEFGGSTNSCEFWGEFEFVRVRANSNPHPICIFPSVARDALAGVLDQYYNAKASLHNARHINKNTSSPLPSPQHNEK